MKHFTAHSRVGLLTAALVFVFTLATIVPAEAKTSSLKSQLRKNGMSMKLVRLDRVDGFMIGLSFTGPQGNNFVLAPGLGGTFLAQVGDNEVIMQRDAAGKMQIIQADGDLSLALCIVKTVVVFIDDLNYCTQLETTPVCLFKAVFDLVTNIMACNTTIPIE